MGPRGVNEIKILHTSFFSGEKNGQTYNLTKNLSDVFVSIQTNHTFFGMMRQVIQYNPLVNLRNTDDFHCGTKGGGIAGIEGAQNLVRKNPSV